ncbi:MAG TPA: DegT/DnrJ/EryC1/StrS family aminotransferase [Planctomycetaceae bacterium]|nr:DegT/DnrJ/EryC1/StrS family aminotransferase [Planctomycetaceae bacterium]
MADILSFPVPPEAADAPVPFIDLVAQYREIAPQMSEAVAKVFAEQKFILGEEVSLLETEVAAYCDAREAIGCASGTDALLLALMALDIQPGDEVITTPYTFFATASTIVRAGARPVFVDVDRETLNLDPEAVAAAITPRTRAIMPVHLFGQCADMEPLWRLATQHGLEIIEDACQAIGAEYHGRRAGVLGRVACFSFFPTKNLGGAGDGGMLTTDDLQLAKRLKKLRVHGESSQYHHDEVGLNSRLDALQAAVLRVKLPHLESWTYGRQANAAHYETLFDVFGVRELIEVPPTQPVCRHVYNQYCVRIRNGRRDELFAGLRERKIGCMIYYPRPLHLQECFANLGYRAGSLPVAEAAAQETIALPIFSELTESQQERVVKGIAEAAGIKRVVPRSAIPCRVHPGVRELERRRRESA